MSRFHSRPISKIIYPYYIFKSVKPRLFLVLLLSALIAACGDPVSKGSTAQATPTPAPGAGGSGTPTPTPTPTANSIAYSSTTAKTITTQGVGGTAQGRATLTFRVTDSSGNAVSGANVAFSVNTGATSTPSLSLTSANTDSNGDAKVIVTSSSTAGNFTIRATVGSAFIDSESITIANRINNAISSTAISERVLNYANSGGIDQATLTFNVRDINGQAVQGVSVNFTLNDSGGTGATLNGSSDTSDASGNARAVVKSGSFPGVFSVRASISNGPASSDVANAESADLVITSGFPVQGGLSIGMKRNLPNAYKTVGLDNTINLTLKDKLGNPVRDGSVVRFISPECGFISPSCSTTKGECSVTWSSDNTRPNNHRCTILAYTNGFEDFTDTNRNGVFDSGETPLNDIGEPYVDLDESETFTAGEPHVESIINGIRDAADGQWTSNGVLIFSNQFFILPSENLSSSFNTSPVARSTINLAPPNSSTATITVTNLGDEFGNALPAGTTIEFSGNGEIDGANPITIEETDRNQISSYSVTVRRDNTPNTDDLTLTISIGDSNIKYIRTWTVID